MDYGRFKFEALKREKDSRRDHNVVQLKEQKLRPKISDHDFRTKLAKVKQFLGEGDKVKLTIMFRGREMVHQEFGRKLLDRMTEELSDLAIIERSPLVEGRNMIMILSPTTKKHAARRDRPHDERAPRGRAGARRATAPQPRAGSAGDAARAAVRRAGADRRTRRRGDPRRRPGRSDATRRRRTEARPRPATPPATPGCPARAARPGRARAERRPRATSRHDHRDKTASQTQEGSECRRSERIRRRRSASASPAPAR